MKVISFVGIVFLLIIMASYFGCQEKPNPLHGTWKMVSGTYIGPEFKVDCTEEERMCYKLISDKHFAVVEICPDNPDSNLFTAFGKYSLSDSIYTEHYEATNVAYKIGTQMDFRYSLEENNNLWIIEAKEEDMELHEVWKRVIHEPQQ